MNGGINYVVNQNRPMLGDGVGIVGGNMGAVEEGVYGR